MLPTSVIGSYSFPRWLDHARELGSKGILAPEVVADHIHQALKYIPAEKMVIVPTAG